MNEQNAYTAENAENNEANTAKENKNPYSAEGSYNANQPKTEGSYNAYQTYTARSFDPVPPKDSNSLSVVSLIFGILAIAAICCCGTSLLFGAVAVICALVRRSKRGSMDGMAIAGLVMGIIGALFGLVGVMITAFSFTGVANSGLEDALNNYFGMEYYIG